MFRRPAFALILLLASSSGQALTVFVGTTPGSACGHPVYASIAEALEVLAGVPGEHLIKVQRTVTEGGRVENNIGAGISTLAGNIVIEGGYFSNCNAPDSGQFTTASATQAGARVMSLSHNGDTQRRVTLRNIRLRNGGSFGTAPLTGGNLNVSGNLHVVLEGGSRLIGGRSSFSGGGAHVGANSGQQALIELRGDSLVENNRSGLGGGVSCVANGRVQIRHASFDGNVASQEGGAIYLASTCQGLFLNPDGSGPSRFSVNTAGDPDSTVIGSTMTRGGAIYAATRIDITGGGNAPQHSVEFIGNRARDGGALFVRGGSPRVNVDLRKALFAGNVAQDRGGAVFLLNSVRFVMNHDYLGDDCFDLLPGCSSFVQNVAQGQGGSISRAAAIYATHDAPPPVGNAEILVERTLFFGNQGGRVVLVHADEHATFNVRHSIFDNNASSAVPRYLVEYRGPSPLRMEYNTVLTNPGIRGARLVEGQTLFVTGMIWWNGGARVAWNSLNPDGNGSIVTGQCLLSSTIEGLPTPGSIWRTDPLLDERYRPRSGRSPALDVCDDINFAPSGPGPDFYRQSRGHANPWITAPLSGQGQAWGSYDLGAVEQTDIPLYNGFGRRPTH